MRLDVQIPAARAVTYEVPQAGFLVGSVPGCDVRLPGVNLPPAICLITPFPSGARLRRLAPTCAVMLNGSAAAEATLADGDRLSIAGAEIVVHVPRQEKEQQPIQDLEQLTQLLDVRQKQLEEQAQELENERALWFRRRDELEQECRGLEDRRGQAQTADAQQAAAQREEMTAARRQLHDTYRQRSDRLAAMQESINHAARKLQERKRQLEEEFRQATVRQKEDAARRAELEMLADELGRAHDERAQTLDRRQHELDTREQEVQRLLEETETERHRVESLQSTCQQQAASWDAACQAREQKLAQERRELEETRVRVDAKHREDLLRLDRLEAVLNKRQEQMQVRVREIDHRQEQLHRDSRDLEEQGQQLEEWHQKLAAEARRLAEKEAEVEAHQQDLNRRSAAVEEQQATLATLRTRLERSREELQADAREVAAQQSRQEEMEAEVRRRLQEVTGERDKVERAQHDLEEDQRGFEERRLLLEKAVEEMRGLQDMLDAERERIRKQTEAHAKVTAEQEDQAARLRDRAEQLVEIQRRLDADRQALRERETEVLQAEQARTALQEQLLRRSQELGEQQQSLAQDDHEHSQLAAALQVERDHVEKQRQELGRLQNAQRQWLQGRVQELKKRATELSRREQTLRANVGVLKTAGRKVSAARKALHVERLRWQTAQAEAVKGHQDAVRALAHARTELEQARRQAAELQNELPDLELRAQGAAQSLARAREQLRRHLAELHAYARQSHEDLAELRTRIQADAEQLRQQITALHRDRDEHRVSVAAFRQQLSEWQAHLADMRTTLARDGTRLERRQARVEADSVRLAKQAEDLEVQEREVVKQRSEMERHLSDMREWYRRKLRELSEREREESGGDPLVDEDVGRPAAASEHGVISLTGDIDSADRQLGELLCSLDLIEPESLTALLVEAWKQRRSLREILLASGCVTLYQLALIEAGNVDALMLGPVRVVDRLRVTPHEAIYRVFDPRGGRDIPEAPITYALLRHLAEADMDDPARAADYRQEFRQAVAVQHANVAATLEVLPIAGRPAVLQEWVCGLPSTDWGSLAAVPGVWFRLLRQAALGLQAIHGADLAHGHLQPESFVLTSDGTVKICGFGEPLWLSGNESDHRTEVDIAEDFAALGRVAEAWASSAPRRKGAKGRPLPEPVQQILHGLGVGGKKLVFESATALLEELDRLSGDKPSNPEAWDRLLLHVRRQTAEDAPVRQSA